MPLYKLEKLFRPKEMELLKDPSGFVVKNNKNIVKTTKFRAKKHFLDAAKELLEIAKNNPYMFNGNSKERIEITKLIRGFLGERVRIITQPLDKSTKREIVKRIDKGLDNVIIQIVKKRYEED